MAVRPRLYSLCGIRARRVFTTIPLIAVCTAGASVRAHADETLPVTDPAPAQQADSPPARERTVGPLRVERFRRLHWSPETNGLRSEGPVNVVYKDPGTKVETVLTATDLNYDGASDRVRAPGISTVTRPDGRFQGYNIDYNLRANTGRIENATVASDYFRMSGDVIERLSDGSYHLINGDFTTCIHSTPDYRFHVRDLTFEPTRFVKAHNVRLYLGNFALPAIPFYRRNFSTASGFPIPTPGYDKRNGITLRLQDSPIERKYETLDYNLNFSLRRAPTGYAVFQHDIGKTPVTAPPPRILLPTFGDPLSGLLELITPPTYREYADNLYSAVSEPRTTLFATVQNQQYVYNRRRNDIAVSRFPEVGVQFFNILGHRARVIPGQESTIPDMRPSGVGAAARYRTPNTPALLNITAGVGEFLETPTHVSDLRLGIRANLASQPLLLGRRLSMRAGVSEFFNVYSRGTVYQMLAPEVELDLAPTRDSLINVGYRYVSAAGRTPFVFDRRDMRHELRIQYQVSGPWAFGIVSKIDLERSKAYDGEIAVARNFDCMQVGVVYRLRSQSFNILFSLLPPHRDKARPLMPLHARP